MENTTIGKRLKNFREDLHLSQSYVADYIGVSRTALVKVEAGQRKVSPEEIVKLADLYSVSTDEILKDSQSIDGEAEYFARSYQELTESDREEIKNIIKFKKRLKQKLKEKNKI